jgi:large-conductance mechanosensitive channel
MHYKITNYKINNYFRKTARAIEGGVSFLNVIINFVIVNFVMWVEIRESS